MLINTGASYTAGEIATFKLVNGDEVVAKVVSQDAMSFTVNKPMTVVPAQKGIMLMQSLFTGEGSKDITLSAQHVMMHSSVPKDVQDYYFQLTTGIQTAPPGMIV
jgi:hypothetical protein